MLAGVCVGGWDRGVGEVVVFSMGTRLLTATTTTTRRHTSVISNPSDATPVWRCKHAEDPAEGRAATNLP